MNAKNNIIVIGKNVVNHQAFVELMSKTESILNDDAENNPENYRKLSPLDLEKCSVDTLKLACSGLPFDPDEIKLISGHKFPDIVAGKYYGVEVKSTMSDTWMSTGSSIVETTRVDEVGDIYMLFGKLGGDIPRFKCRPYQDVLYDIAVTHSPRYLINMELKKDQTIFSKMGTTYELFRQSEDSITQVRKYYREQAVKQNKQEMPWWITADNIDHGRSFNITLWNSLGQQEKHDLQAKCMILFPEALNPARNMTKYNNTTLWLCSYNQVINPNIRDLYSAGGKITHVNGERLATPVAQVFNQIVQYSDTIKQMLMNPTVELFQMIAEYNPVLLRYRTLYEGWLKICYAYAKIDNVPLEKWIAEKPIFTFSK